MSDYSSASDSLKPCQIVQFPHFTPAYWPVLRHKCLAICLPVCPSVSPSVRLPTCLSVCLRRSAISSASGLHVLLRDGWWKQGCGMVETFDLLWKQRDVLLQNTALFASYLQVFFWVTFALQLGFDSRFTLRVSWRIVSFIVLKGIILNSVISGSGWDLCATTFIHWRFMDFLFRRKRDTLLIPQGGIWLYSWKEVIS